MESGIFLKSIESLIADAYNCGALDNGCHASETIDSMVSSLVKVYAEYEYIPDYGCNCPAYSSCLVALCQEKDAEKIKGQYLASLDGEWYERDGSYIKKGGSCYDMSVFRFSVAKLK